MGLKFRRGTNAQKSGSLAFGEPYVNTDLGTLQIGGLTGDITLGASGTGSAGSFSGISGSSIDITGNAKIDGNLTLGGTITIGDNSSDNVVVNADLSSSIIPNNDNSFDLGSTSFRYRAIHGTNIYGAINATNGVVSGSSQVVGILTSLNTFSASNDNTSLNAFSASENTKSETLRLYTASVDTKFSTLQTLTASMTAQVARLQESTASLNLYTSSQDTKNSTLGLYTASLETKNTTLATYTASLETKNTTLATYTASLEAKNTTLATYTASLEAKNTTLATYTASVSGHITDINTKTGSFEAKFTTLQTLTASMAAQVSRLQESTASLNAFTNSFNSAIQLTGSNVNIGGNLTVAGTTTTINSTAVAIADSVIELNYGGSVVKSGILTKDGTGGSTISGSLLWDGTNDYWIAGISGSELPLATTTGTQTLTNKTIDGSQLVALSVANGKLTNSSITIAGTSTALGGAITAEQIRTAIGTVVSGSAQIDGSLLGSNKTITVGSTAITLGGTATTLAGLTSVTSTAFVGALTGNASTATTLATARTINGTSFNGSADITIANLVSGSLQIDHNSTTNYVANRHIDHTAVSISAGSGLSGGGDISATRTLSLDTTSATFTTGVTTQNNALAVVSGSRTISGIALGSNLATLTIGTGLSGTSYNGSTGVTIANTGVLSVTTNTGLSTNASATGNITITNTGVTSNVAGTGISVSGATGTVTITNSGVTSIVAGTGVSRDSATGAVTISIGQAVATSSNVQFNSLGIGMAASATAGRIDATNDIVAYSSSDIRFKENIKPIENALQKISKISGNTYDWKAENKIEHGYEGNDVGVIAQEIEEVLPQLVQTRDNGYKAVKYDKLVALLIEGIKEQQTQIHSLTIEIEKLKESKGL
jgi:hypothetical protein